MTNPVKNTNAMIAGMEPQLQPGEFAFVVWADDKDWPDIGLGIEPSGGAMCHLHRF